MQLNYKVEIKEKELTKNTITTKKNSFKTFLWYPAIALIVKRDLSRFNGRFGSKG